MKVVLDTNVFMSGIFFSGPPFQILNAWREGRLQLVASAEILDEYQRVGDRLALLYPLISAGPLILLVALHGEIVLAPELSESVCDDSTDDKFFACALAANCSIIVSGDKHLLRADGYRGVHVHRPRAFMDEILSG